MSTHHGPCAVLAAGAIELYFYDELEAAERLRIDRHVGACAECRAALDELRVIRETLARRPDVSSPPGGDWSAFMARLDSAVNRYSVDRYSVDRYTVHRGTQRTEGTRGTRGTGTKGTLGTPGTLGTLGTPGTAWIAMAALLALVTMSVVSVVRWRATQPAQEAASVQPQQPAAASAETSPRRALVSASEHHLERSKLVLLGLTAKDPDAASPDEWTYERELATSLLNDTRLYRLAAEERGMNTLAGVLRDLELVLLQTSFTDSDPQALGQIQRLIRKRDLLEKMDVVTTSGI